MSAHLNGHRLPDDHALESVNGTVHCVAVCQPAPIEPDPPRATGSFAAALRFVSGHDARTLAEIADAEGVSKARIGFLAVQIADRLGISTTSPGRRRERKSASHPKAEDAVVFNDGAGVNGSDPHLELTKLWMRCGPRARREFLDDVRAAHPQLWEQVTKEEA